MTTLAEVVVNRGMSQDEFQKRFNAPEYGWNDYQGLDVKGKTVVILVNDPGFENPDSGKFQGKTMTYYGRWTYKYEEASRQGAAAGQGGREGRQHEEDHGVNIMTHESRESTVP